jgi:hypothetical protein
MDEPILRFLIVLLAASLVTLAGWLARRPRRVGSEPLAHTALEPGVYLFTSGTCSSCEPARAVVAAKYHTYQEIRWEEGTVEFSRHGIGRVPTLIVVHRDGTGLRWEGVPRAAELPAWGP